MKETNWYKLAYQPYNLNGYVDITNHNPAILCRSKNGGYLFEIQNYSESISGKRTKLNAYVFAFFPKETFVAMNRTYLSTEKYNSLMDDYRLKILERQRIEEFEKEQRLETYKKNNLEYIERNKPNNSTPDMFGDTL